MIRGKEPNKTSSTEALKNQSFMSTENMANLSFFLYSYLTRKKSIIDIQMSFSKESWPVRIIRLNYHFVFTSLRSTQHFLFESGNILPVRTDCHISPVHVKSWESCVSSFLEQLQYILNTFLDVLFLTKVIKED